MGALSTSRKLDEAVRDQGLEREQVPVQLGCRRVIPPSQRFGELQQPCPAVRPLEGSVVLALEVRDLRLYVLTREGPVQPVEDGIPLLEPGEPPEQGHQRPVAVDRRMPVEAAVEARMQRPGRKEVPVRAQHVGRLVRVLPLDAIEGEAVQVVRHRGRERQPSILLVHARAGAEVRLRYGLVGGCTEGASGW
jgi:hypothetical protein